MTSCVEQNVAQSVHTVQWIALFQHELSRNTNERQLEIFVKIEDIHCYFLLISSPHFYIGELLSPAGVRENGGFYVTSGFAILTDPDGAEYPSLLTVQMHGK